MGTVDKRTPRIRVGAIIVNNNEILLVKHVKPHASYWLLPGGGVEPGETLPDALRRELQEEACLEIDPGEPCMLVDSIMPDGGRHIVNVHFRATILSGEPRLGIDDTVSEVAFVPLADLPGLTFYPNVAENILRAVDNRQAGIEYITADWKD